ncbi:MAG: MBL fold metallo-hydrolase [Planctomycetes bacterium]|nr:MBL fold metallo-hydrolase [Planctomycetota bacterium]
MLIRCWGSRGSIPVSGKEYLKYGGSTTCLEIRTKNDYIIIVDAGSGIRKLGNKLISEKRFEYSLVFTHAHWDHILGFPFFKPIHMKQTKIDMFGCPFAQDSVKNIISGTMVHPNFPVNYSEVKADITYHGICTETFKIDSISVSPILLSHPDQGMGYKFTEDGKSFIFITDNELTYKHPGGLEYADYVKACAGVDLLIHDAEFTAEEYARTKTWGHSVYTDALRLALEAKVKKFGLFHHNQEREDEAIDGFVSDCRRIIKNKKSSLDCFATAEGMELGL